MVGGLVWALAQGYRLKECIGWGAASGAADRLHQWPEVSFTADLSKNFFTKSNTNLCNLVIVRRLLRPLAV